MVDNINKPAETGLVVDGKPQEPAKPAASPEKPLNETVTDPANQDQPTQQQADAQSMNTAKLEKSDGSGNTDQSQVVVDTEQAVGYRGHNPSPVPNENYTLAGVTSGKPTPETDVELRDEMHRRLDINRHMTTEAKKASE